MNLGDEKQSQNSSGIRTPYTLKRSSELQVDIETKPNELEKLDSVTSVNNMPKISFGPNN